MENSATSNKPVISGGTLRRLHMMIRSNWITSMGTALMTLSVFGLITVFVFHSSGLFSGPYIGIVTVFVLPGVFVIGLLMAPLGLLVYRRHLQSRLEVMADRPLYLARAVVVLTVINFGALGTVGYGGVSYMSSTQFCGTACHSAMEPEYVAYQSSPHSRVGCVDCHVGPGAESFVKSKINGVKQLVGFITDDYSRPIKAPVHGMRDAKDTCENCHWPEKYLGTKLVVRPRFREDEAVTPYINVLLLRTGGTRPDGESVGIHWHVQSETSVEFIASDERREKIPWVRVTKPDGSEEVFATDALALNEKPEGSLRKMDCNDCHNRAAHEFDRPEDAVDRAISAGLISRRLPFVKKIVLEALRTDWTRENAAEGIRKSMQKEYTSLGKFDEDTRQLVEAAVEQTVSIWMRNVYPDRKLLWNAYPALDTHFGCYRCHDDLHTNSKGETISQECDLCHTVLSEEEENPAILNALGLARKKQ